MIAILNSCERGTVRSGEWDLDSHRQSEHRSYGYDATLLTNGMVLVAAGSTTVASSRARNCMIRRAGAGLSPAA